MRRSPFPGMDPYLEERWSDVHGTLITLLKEALQPTLPPDLRERSEERVLVETSEREVVGELRTDVAIVPSGGPATRAVKGSGASAATLETFVVEVQPRTVVDRSLRIIDLTKGNRVVTAIEVLSPWNKKKGRLNRLYRRKLATYARAKISVVEIDLLRSPRTRLPVGQQDLPAEHRTPYLYSIHRAWQQSQWELCPVSLRLPVPPLLVPLRRDESAVSVELQPLIDRVYIAGGHDDIDYGKPPQPPLEGDDAVWAEALLKAVEHP